MIDLEEPQIRALIETHGAPLLLVSPRTVLENYRRLQDQLPRVGLYYAVKSNPDRAILAALAGAGSGFDVATSGELEAVVSLGVAPGRIIQTNPIKGFGEIGKALARGIDTFFFDNPVELEKIAREAPGACVMLRLGVVNPNCVVDLGAKFGCPPDDAEALLKRAIELGLQARGLCFHVGSQTSIPQPYVEMIHLCRALFNRMALAENPLRTLDIGGGFPVSYKTHMMSIEAFCTPIRDALNSFFPDTEILAEPGRALSANAAILAARVIGRSVRAGTTWYYLEDGIYGTFSGAVFDHARYEVVALKEGDLRPCILSGPTCDSFDVISKEELLPELDVGDLVIARNMGAYSNASATTFNGIPLTKAVAID